MLEERRGKGQKVVFGRLSRNYWEKYLRYKILLAAGSWKLLNYLLNCFK